MHQSYLVVAVPVDVSVEVERRGYKEAVDDCRQEVLLTLRQRLSVTQALSEVDEMQVPEFKVLLIFKPR